MRIWTRILILTLVPLSMSLFCQILFKISLQLFFYDLIQTNYQYPSRKFYLIFQHKSVSFTSFFSMMGFSYMKRSKYLPIELSVNDFYLFFNYVLFRSFPIDIFRHQICHPRWIIPSVWINSYCIILLEDYSI